MNPSPINPLRRASAWLTDLVVRKAASRTARQDDPASGTLFLVACCTLAMVIVGLAGYAAFATWDDRREFDAAMARYDAQRVTEQQIRAAVRQYGPAAPMSATWYGSAYEGRTTASGTIFNAEGITAAHARIPFGTVLQVAYQGRQIEVQVTDRMPASAGPHAIDLSAAAFRALAPIERGRLQVQVRQVVP